MTFDGFVLVAWYWSSLGCSLAFNELLTSDWSFADQVTLSWWFGLVV